MAWQVPQLKKFNFSEDTLVNRDWYEKSWSGVLFPLYIVGYGCVYVLSQRFVDAFNISVTYVKDDKMSWFWDGRDIKRIRERILNTVIENPKMIDQWFEEWALDQASFERTVVELEQIRLSDLSDADLYNRYAQLRDAYAAANSLPYLVDSFLTSGEDDWLASMIREELVGKVDEKDLLGLVAKLTSPVEYSFCGKELIALLKIAIKYTQGKDCSVDLAEHTKQYYWIQNGYYPTPSLDEKYFLDKIKVLVEEGGLEEKLRVEEGRVKKNKKEKEALFKELGISAKLQAIIETAGRFTGWQDTRKSVVFITNHFVFTILREIGKRVGLEPFEIYYVTDHELKNVFLHKQFDKEKLRQRREEGCIFIHTPAGAYLMEGEEVKKYPKDIFSGFNKSVSEVRGTPACLGKVTGRVRVIQNVLDFVNFQEGEILVTNNTTPDFVPLMKKAIAIVTEQGGITTHAAIVSRELNKPCVIGTKIATKVLKDGDLVEVDANNGIVKIIK